MLELTSRATTPTHSVAILGTLAVSFLIVRLGYRSMFLLAALSLLVIQAVVLGGGSPWVVATALTLQGFFQAMFLVGGMLYVNSVAPSNIRALAQGVWLSVSGGLSEFFAFLVIARGADLCATAFNATRGGLVFPLLLGLAALVALFWLFREKTKLDPVTMGRTS
jgi:MFS family permease